MVSNFLSGSRHGEDVTTNTILVISRPHFCLVSANSLIALSHALQRNSYQRTLVTLQIIFLIILID